MITADMRFYQLYLHITIESSLHKNMVSEASPLNY